RAGTIAIQDSDEFDGKALGLQWEWNHNPLDDHWSLSARPGFLRLTASPATDLVTAHNTQTQILQGPEMTATARLDVSHLSEGERAGLAMLSARPSWAGVVRSGKSMNLVYSSGGVETPGPALKGGSLDLRVKVTADQKAQYSFSTDGGQT